ncbi:hypothetical protein HER32_19445 [Hymenobacter sp. BT18]|uniref:hypothetical protein n=1 Tax=Hymenobacter sp. BT18 TaxID=2835648 RepID=UPI00143E1F24|nr:hypothetical protein [Hymenobacter sp. BT18]QIX63228.1 hypothetical protein HER32_19445 [Hymenobacter sp. BT18]
MLTANLQYLHTSAPLWLSALFICCTAATAALLARALQRAGLPTGRYWLLAGVWLALQAVLAGAGFYQQSLEALPPRLVVTGILPTVVVLLMVLLSGTGRRGMARLPLADLAGVSVVRVGVEVGLYGLAAAHLVPELMTFAGRNFDVLAGLSAPVVAAFYRHGRLGRGGLLAWHLGSLVLLGTIVGLALLTAPTPLQQLAFGQPNVAVVRFPFVWLATFIVPVVLFTHVASLYLLWRPRPAPAAG